MTVIDGNFAGEAAPVPTFGTVEWYDRMIAEHGQLLVQAQAAIQAATVKAIQEETAVAIFTQERALRLERESKWRASPDTVGEGEIVLDAAGGADVRTAEHSSNGAG